MLRLIVLALLLANAAFLAWSQGMLLAWGIGPTQQAEPQRLAQQIRPEAIRVLKPEEARRIEAAAASSRTPECLQASPLDDALAATVKGVLSGVAEDSWKLEEVAEPARWIVYMGKYPSVDLVTRKKAELRQLGISFEPISNPSLEPGLSLGGAATEEEARQQLQTLTQRGVRTARVVQERPEVRGRRLLLPAADDLPRPKLEELKAALGARATLRSCR